MFVMFDAHIAYIAHIRMNAAFVPTTECSNDANV